MWQGAKSYDGENAWSSVTKCCGSVIFWYGSESADPSDSDMDLAPDPDIFVTFLQDGNKKFFFFQIFFLLLFEATFASFFKDKKSEISHKTVGFKVFLLLLLDDRRIRSRIRTSY